mmetsp:Transcript_33705/g.69614  ORF Transcript_33705/g.69614 Transcript_33705/m.69614 type:complete len:290 (+) Transcript_33705:1666-2535(+)
MGLDEGLLGVVEHVGQRVDAHLEVGGIDAHSLLAHGGLVGVAGGLVVVGEGDDTRAHAQHHRGVDLAVCVAVQVAASHVFDEHGDVACLLLHDVDVLDELLAQQLRPGGLLVLEDVGALHVQQPVLVHYQQRAHEAAVVGGDEELALRNVARHADLVDHAADGHFTALVAEGARKVLRLVRHPHPHPVHKHLGPAHVCAESRGGQLLQVLHPASLKQLNDDLGRAADADVRHERQVLHQPARLPLRRLRRTHHPPLRVVQLARLRDLALLADGRVGPPQMRQRCCKRQP